MDDARCDAAWREIAAQWPLSPDVAHLNHGSFGAPPRPVLAERQRWLERMAADPMDFFLRQYHPALDEARTAVARFVGAAATDLALVENSTFAMNIVAHSFELGERDEVLLNDHEYGAVRRIWEDACGRAGARLVDCPVPLPLADPGQVTAAIAAGLTPRTRLIVCSHVSSPTAVRFPVADICRLGQAAGASVCIDGPHAVGSGPLDLAALDCDYYTASCHKWLCAPHGAGFLYAHRRVQARMRPLVRSWGRTPEGKQPGWQDEVDWSGTRDASPLLALPAAISFFEALGWDAVWARIERLIAECRERLARVPGLEPVATDAAVQARSMAAFFLPDAAPDRLDRRLWEEHRIHAPLMQWRDRRLLRVSCHVYNTSADLDRLQRALKSLIA